MFDFVRNLTKSAEEKQQELLTAYLDDTLPPADRQQVETLLSQDAGLRAQVRQQRLVKQQLSQLPRRRVPRSFALDPAVYGKPTPRPFFQLYPVLQTATGLVALLLLLVVGLDAFGGAASLSQEMETAQVTAVQEAPAAESAAVADEELMEEAGESAAFETAADDVAPAAAPAQTNGFAVPEEAADAAPVPTAVAPIPQGENAVVVERQVVPAETTAEAAPASEAEAADAAAAETAVSATPNPLRGLQIGLAISLFLLLILTLLVRQRIQ